MPLPIVPPAADPRPVRPDLSAVVSVARFFDRSDRMNPDALYASAESFFHELERSKIDHVLVGGLALHFYGDARNTEDVDLILAWPDTAALEGLVIEERNEWFAKSRFGSLRVDLLLTDNPFFALMARRHAAVRTWHGHRIRVATAAGLMLLKLYALPSLYRQGQIARASVYESDLIMLLLAHPSEDAALLEPLRPFMLESDINALGAVLRDLRARMERSF